MTGIYFFDVPVYRLPEERYFSEMNVYADKIIYSGPPQHLEMLKKYYADNPERESSFRSHIQQSYGGTWEYNEIIGYIQLHFLGSQIRGEYWQIKGKKIQRTRRKVFEWRTWKLAPEMDIPASASNQEIFSVVQQYLAACGKELKRRHIDSRRLEAIGPHVDWRSLLAIQRITLRSTERCAIKPRSVVSSTLGP